MLGKRSAPILTLTLACSAWLACASRAEEARSGPPPNIVFILADDLGYGDLSCYGQQRFQTPHIDRLAAEGVRFTNHYAGSTVCAPSRCCLMTGKHTGHATIRGNREVKPIGQAPIRDADVTIAEVLHAAGYQTGVVGKWGLGFPGSEGDPNRQGFEYFYGYNCQRNAHHHYPPFLWRNDQQILLPGNNLHTGESHSHDLLTAEALAFIERNAGGPFFLYVPYCVPHASLTATEDLASQFRGSFEEPAPSDEPSSYRPTDEPRTQFAAMIAMLDRDVGRIMDQLARLGLDDNTLVIFTSDNGPHREGGATPEFFNSNGGLRGVKRDLYEGGIRVPMVARWPQGLSPGRTSDHVSAFWDVLPTLAEIAETPAPGGLDGISFAPALTGEGTQPRHDYLYWEFPSRGGKQAIRRGDWKAVRLNVNAAPEGPVELYNLRNDPAEENDLSGERPELANSLAALMAEAHADLPEE